MKLNLRLFQVNIYLSHTFGTCFFSKQLGFRLILVSVYLQMVKQLQVLAQLDSKNMDAIDELKSTMGKIYIILMDVNLKSFQVSLASHKVQYLGQYYL